MSDSRLAASVTVSFDVFITEVEEVNTPDRRELGYSHVEVLSYDLVQTDVVENRRELLKELIHHDGIVELDPDDQFSEAIHEALNKELPFEDFH